MALDPNLPLEALNPKFVTPIDSPFESAAKATVLAVRQQQLADLREQAQSRAALRSALQQSGGDLEKATQAVLMTNPLMGIKMREALTDAQKTQFLLQKAKLDHDTAIAQYVGRTVGSAADQQEHDLALAQLQHAGIPTDGISPTFDPAQRDRIRRQALTVEQQLEASRKEQARTREVKTVDEQGNPVTKIIEDVPGQSFPIAPGEGKETGPAMDAAYQTLVAKQALGKPLTPEEAANKKAYEQRKLVGPEYVAAQAGARQAATQAQQNTILARTQSFQEKQAGRKELQEKVIQPYETARSSAQELRDIIAEAKAGNKVAGSLQSLMTTMAAIRSQGLNRINTAEIGVTADAGSLWDRVMGRIGKYSAGEPVPPDIQQDMIRFADVLEKSARHKYDRGFASVKKTYGLEDTPEPADSGGGGGGGAPTTPTSSTPNLAGLAAGHKRTFDTGPFAGQVWTIGADGQPKRLK